MSAPKQKGMTYKFELQTYGGLLDRMSYAYLIFRPTSDRYEYLTATGQHTASAWALAEAQRIAAADDLEPSVVYFTPGKD